MVAVIAGGNTVYQFELSLRSSLDKSKSAIHLTYLGSCTSAIEIAGSEKDSLTNLSFGAGMKCTRVVVLQHATKLPTDIESKEPFWSIKDGGGTFEISRFGVNPLRNTGMSIVQGTAASRSLKVLTESRSLRREQ